jgi:hypothetical protein
MDIRKKRESKPVVRPPRIYEAKLAPGPSGVVFKGREIDETTALAERRASRDIVVCGDDVDANRNQARAIESAVGACKRHDPHVHAGLHALPHYQQDNPPPSGHTFYETANPQRKARKQP